MPVPRFVIELRRKVGHDLLLLPGVAAVVLDADGRVLLHRRADTGEWALICGVLEPGEDPAAAAAREVWVEAGLRVRAVRLADAAMSPPVQYPNGDRAQFLMVAYRCAVLGSDARVNDEESLEVRFFAPAEFPPLREDYLRYIARATSADQ